MFGSLCFLFTSREPHHFFFLFFLLTFRLMALSHNTAQGLAGRSSRDAHILWDSLAVMLAIGTVTAASLLYLAIITFVYRLCSRMLPPNLTMQLHDLACNDLKHAAGLLHHGNEACDALARVLQWNASTLQQAHWEPNMWVNSIDRLDSTLPRCLSEKPDASVGAVRSLFLWAETLKRLAQQGPCVQGGEDVDLEAAQVRLRRLLDKLNQQRRADERARVLLVHQRTPTSFHDMQRLKQLFHANRFRIELDTDAMYQDAKCTDESLLETEDDSDSECDEMSDLGSNNSLVCAR
jgi:hypothetical protein